MHLIGDGGEQIPGVLTAHGVILQCQRQLNTVGRIPSEEPLLAAEDHLRLIEARGVQDRTLSLDFEEPDARDANVRFGSLADLVARDRVVR